MRALLVRGILRQVLRDSICVGDSAYDTCHADSVGQALGDDLASACLLRAGAPWALDQGIGPRGGARTGRPNLFGIFGMGPRRSVGSANGGSRFSFCVVFKCVGWFPRCVGVLVFKYTGSDIILRGEQGESQGAGLGSGRLY